MIKVVEGDILQASEDIIGHQVNCRGVMGSGLAKQIRNKYPEAYDDYILFCKTVPSSELLGCHQFVFVPDCDTRRFKIVANLFGQFNYGRQKGVLYTDYKALETCLSELKEYAKEDELSVALPYKLGCGLANGDWDNVVYPMIERIFTDYDVTLYKFGG
ncbi:macro domain-containing protein [Bacillus sp. ISTL8]|uniref:macro domain-containing protein n=1 Tax=Bacillus sp. ISTL8 TaxID=2596896 RepID=UPI0014565A56|nr:macro domain-containing protein [Bacillus sp. ISTL8]